MKADSLLFKVVIEHTKTELDVAFIAEATDRISRCVRDLLAVAGYHGELRTELGNEGHAWYLAFKVIQSLAQQLDLLVAKPPSGNASQAADQVIEAAVIALARFHREVQPVIAARLSETLKQLKSADPRVIAALARQPGRKLTLLQESGELELRIQTQSHRSLATEPEMLFGYIVAVGYVEMSVVPINRRSRSRLCIHPIRVRIPHALRVCFDPIEVLRDFVEPKKKLELQVCREVAVRKRQHVTFELVAWPPQPAT